MKDQFSPDHIEMVEEFCQEIRDLLDELEPVIVDMGKGCGAEGQQEDISDDINGIFRLFHSIKGAAGFLNFPNIATASHSAENLLDLIRTGAMSLQPDHIDLFCQGCDFIREGIEHVCEHYEDEGLSTQSQVIRDRFLAAIEVDPQEAPEEQGPAVIDLDLDPASLISPEMSKNFVSESQDILQTMETALLNWLKDKGNQDLHGDVFRQIHSFKGNCGFLGFADLESLSHHLETAIDLARSGGAADPAKIADMALNLIDIYRETLADIGEGGPGKIEGLSIYLDMINDQLPPQDRVAQDVAGQEPDRLGDILVEQGAATKAEVDVGVAQQSRQLGAILVESGAVSHDQVDRALETQKERKKKKAGAGKVKATKRQDLRVDLGKLDQLIDLIGELVIAENMVVNSPDLEEMELDHFQKSSQHLGKIVRDLQEMAMTLRMIPVSGLFRRMIRLVHDLSRKSGKKVELILSGEETEVDKTVIETITDPLVHLLRNSMDHGIEPQDVRLEAGKESAGIIRLSAVHEEGNVKISIEDDGGGLPRDKILAKAREKGILQDAADMPDSEIYKLIFAPGFSTAAEITDVSGRGVGMDVVRQNINKVNGSIDIKSRAGQGTTVDLRIPLTLAIIEGMLVRCGISRYIIPIINIMESFRPNPGMITVGPDGQEVVKVRENLLPVVRLHDLHNVAPDNHELEKGILIVLEARGSNFCLLVDELLGQQQTVIKGLSDYVSSFGNAGGVSGCTIMGNGEVCLILDVQSVLDRLNEGGY